jgi:hypothetical protein
MKSLIRKNEKTPGWVRLGLAQRGFDSLEDAMADELFRHLEARPKSKQAERVEQILDLLSRLGRGDQAVFFQKGNLLSRYEWRYGLTFSGKRGLRAELMFTKELAEEDAWEYRAVRFLMSLVPHRINRLRLCVECNGWFFAAKRERQKFCKRGACRQKHYDSDPARRMHKKKYMRGLRELHARKLFRERSTSTRKSLR